jgi:hypothetical protein
VIPGEAEPPDRATIAVQDGGIVREHQFAADLDKPRIGFERRNRRRRPAGIELDVAVDQGDISGGRTAQADIAGDRRPLRRLAQVIDPAGQPAREIGHDRFGIVGRGIVDHEYAERSGRPALPRDGAERARQCGRAVEGRHDEQHGCGHRLCHHSRGLAAVGGTKLKGGQRMASMMSLRRRWQAM